MKIIDDHGNDKHHASRCHSGFGPSSRFGPPGPNLLVDMDPPFLNTFIYTKNNPTKGEYVKLLVFRYPELLINHT